LYSKNPFLTKEYDVPQSQTPAGKPEEKWKQDPVSALHEHFRKQGTEPSYETGHHQPQGVWAGWECKVTLPEPKETISAVGQNQRSAKRKAALTACSKLFA
jgi:hypothetical protein